MTPKSKPALQSQDVEKIITHFGVNTSTYPCLNIGIRGYYLDGQGVKGENDIGIYDDAMFFRSPNVFASFNANTDPSKIKPGVAMLKAQEVYYAHILDTHNGSSSSYPAVCQRSGVVTVYRSGTETLPLGEHSKYGEHIGNGYWVGKFGINIHKGGYTTTSSLGCQTIYPTQWSGYYGLVDSEMRRVFAESYKKRVIPYILVDEQYRRTKIK